MTSENEAAAEEEKPPPPKPVELDPPVEVVVQRWPVKERLVDEDGRIKRTADSYVRTKAPLETRTLTAERFLTRTRAEIYFGIGGLRSFSVRNGRCIGLADWVLEKESMLALRKLAKELFPKQKRQKKKAAAESDSDDEAEESPDFANTPPGNDVR